MRASLHIFADRVKVLKSREYVSLIRLLETLSLKNGFPSKNPLLKANGKLKYISSPTSLPLSMLLLVTWP